MAKRARKTANRRKSHGPAKKVARTGASHARKAAKPAKRRAKPGRARVKVVRSRATKASRARKAVARRPTRPLPPAEMVSERLFLSSLDRSLRDNRLVWEALAKR
jgi:hypothetical protein